MVKSLKKMRKAALGMAASGVTMGVGAYTVGQADVGGNVPEASTAIGKVSSFMPAMGTTMGAGMVFGSMKGMQKSAKRRRRKKKKKKKKR